MQLAERQLRLNEGRGAVQREHLTLHLSPHFMFNALSSVQWILSQVELHKAKSLFSSFVALWKRHWVESRRTTHTLKEELESLGEYIALESARRETPVSWTVEVDPRIHQELILPVLLFQPAIENAFWHAFDPPPPNPMICLKLNMSEQAPAPNWVVASLLDNGKGLNLAPSQTQPEHVSFGSKVTLDRLKNWHPKSGLELNSLTGQWSTEAKFSFPLKLPAALTQEDAEKVLTPTPPSSLL